MKKKHLNLVMFFLTSNIFASYHDKTSTSSSHCKMHSTAPKLVPEKSTTESSLMPDRFNTVCERDLFKLFQENPTPANLTVLAIVFGSQQKFEEQVKNTTGISARSNDPKIQIRVRLKSNL